MNKLPIAQSQPAPAAIRPELLAAKLAAIQNLEYPELSEQIEKRPRLVEMLWFLQWTSMQPGGLKRFTQEMLAQFPDRVGTETLRRARGKRLSLEQKLAVYHELPERVARGEIFATTSEFLAIMLTNSSVEDLEEMSKEERLRLEKELNSWDFEMLTGICRREALEFLPQYLASFCNEAGKGFMPLSRHGEVCETWYFSDVVGAVIEMMDLHAKRVSGRLARTAVTEKVFDALEYACSERRMVRIEGDSRFGKTESVKTWCQSRPGVARLANVPSSNTLMDLLRNIADALGIIHTYKTGQNELKAKVEYVIRHSRLFLVLDEGAFLLPQSFSRNTSPARLNWVRTEIVDKGMPLAIVVTPQSFHTAVNKFVRTTSYAMEQFLGRTSWPVVLPSELEEKDLIAVAKIHFGEMDEDYLGLIAAQAMLCENYLKAVEDIATLARFFAKKDGRSTVELQDVDTAINQVIPSKQEASTAAPTPQSEPTPMVLRKKAAELIKAPLTAGSRGAKPATRSTDPEQNFNPCSLRGAGPGRTEAELVSEES